MTNLKPTRSDEIVKGDKYTQSSIDSRALNFLSRKESSSKVDIAIPTPEEQLINGYVSFRLGTKDGFRESFRWFQKAAERGNPDAQFELSVMYYLGTEIKKNYSESLKWARKAAEQGNSNAQYHVGMMHYLGDGVARDLSSAAEWFHKAAEQGDSRAQYKLGLLYRTGQGLPKDYSKAAKWLHKAAEQGDSRAQYKLGLLYFVGYGVSASYESSYYWLFLASLNDPDNPDYEKKKDYVGERLSLESLGKVLQSVSDWVDQH